MFTIITSRSCLKQLVQYPAQLAGLKAKLAIKSHSEAIDAKYVSELGQMINGLNEFVEQCELKIAEAESVDPSGAEEATFQKLDEALEALYSSADHHLGGAKSAKSRFAAMS